MILVKTIDLKNRIDELIQDGMEYAEVFILESEKYEDEIVPTTLHVDGGRFSKGYLGGYDYEGLEEVDFSKLNWRY